MHISDGVLPVSMLMGGYGLAGGLCAWSLYNLPDKDIPRVAVFTAAFFVASLIHIKIAFASVHLLLNGLLGVVLGRRAFMAIVIGLFLQASLFGHGGFSVLGVNAIIFGVPAMVSWWLYCWLGSQSRCNQTLAGGFSGAVGVLLAGVLFMLALTTAGESLRVVARIALLAHIPIMVVEGLITGFTVDFIARVQPTLLRRGAL